MISGGLLRRVASAGTILAALALLARGLSAPDPALADGLQAGLWKVLNHAEINGMAAPEQQNMRCLTPEAVADLDTTFSPVSRTTNSACERTEHEFTPARLKWHLQCTGQLDMDVAGEFVFDTPEHYTGTIVSQSSMMGRVMQSSRLTIEAQRVGDCAPSVPPPQ